MPQGMSVFQDGVRINEPFGDVVNWDLLPAVGDFQHAVDSRLGPAFGLNTLGGALAIYTKSGARIRAARSSFPAGRSAAARWSSSTGTTASVPTRSSPATLPTKTGGPSTTPAACGSSSARSASRTSDDDLDVSLTVADNVLNGAQTLPQSFLDKPREPYTYPDTNENRLAFVTAKGSRLLRDDQLIDSNVYYRSYRNSNLSSNVDENFGETDPDTGVVHADPATNDRATIDAESYGVALQWTTRGKLGGFAHQLAVGAGGNWGRTRFTQSSQPATFTNDRGTIGAGPYVQTTDVDLHNADAGIYASDTINLAQAWVLTLAGRFNHARVEIADRTGEDAGLNGTHTFSRFNPAIGVNFTRAIR